MPHKASIFIIIHSSEVIMGHVGNMNMYLPETMFIFAVMSILK